MHTYYVFMLDALGAERVSAPTGYAARVSMARGYPKRDVTDFVAVRADLLMADGDARAVRSLVHAAGYEITFPARGVAGSRYQLERTFDGVRAEHRWYVDSEVWAAINASRKPYDTLGDALDAIFGEIKI